MNEKLIENIKPVGYMVGAIVVLMISENVPNNIVFNYIVMALVYLHTMPILLETAKNISKDKFKLICYIYSLIVFLLTRSVVYLLMLNIFQSFEGLYEYQESEANVNRNNV